MYVNEGVHFKVKKLEDSFTILRVDLRRNKSVVRGDGWGRSCHDNSGLRWEVAERNDERVWSDDGRWLCRRRRRWFCPPSTYTQERRRTYGKATTAAAFSRRTLSECKWEAIQWSRLKHNLQNKLIKNDTHESSRTLRLADASLPNRLRAHLSFVMPEVHE